MVFSRRLAALAAVVVIPVGIAATSFALADSPKTPEVPSQVDLPSGSATPTPSRPGPTPSDEAVPRPGVTDNSSDDDDDDDDSGRPGTDRPTGDDRADDDAADDGADDG
ncbi:small secreted hydrophilic protein [Streptomyces sp. AS58]|uniref:small secreted hydrophilic protein n=1 Tax=Streptomyces sp. AS58 TaxID=1519489 RepID=UPI0006AEEEA8|nr:small secreted hydrophilic protein [Streptomyces sp. AS58]KOV74525.1 small secreted hydrophilic protein [Streptomyces sp. AS58]